MSVNHLNDGNFDQEVLKSEIPVLVDFWAPWCGPCRVIAPIIDEIAEEYEGKIKVAKINVDDNPAKTAEYNILSIPSIKIFKNGKVVEEFVGVVPKEEIKKKLEKIL